MSTVITNMCMIHDRETNRVLILDKKVVQGWEGLTFPGGHVEAKESFNDACIREVKEETNLDVEDLEVKGFIQWYLENKDQRQLGILYYTDKFQGELIEDNDEGKLFWMDLDEFLKVKNKSKSMDDCMKVYLGECREVVRYYIGEKLTRIDYF